MGGERGSEGGGWGMHTGSVLMGELLAGTKLSILCFQALNTSQHLLMCINGRATPQELTKVQGDLGNQLHAVLPINYKCLYARPPPPPPPPNYCYYYYYHHYHYHYHYNYNYYYYYYYYY